MRATPPPRADFWIMPDLLGCTLEDAERAIRLVTDGNRNVSTASVDATGQARNKPSQAQWRVSWQAPAGGAWIGPRSIVCFHVALDQQARGLAGARRAGQLVSADRRHIHPESDD